MEREYKKLVAYLKMHNTTRTFTIAKATEVKVKAVSVSKNFEIKRNLVRGKFYGKVGHVLYFSPWTTKSLIVKSDNIQYIRGSKYTRFKSKYSTGH